MDRGYLRIYEKLKCAETQWVQGDMQKRTNAGKYRDEMNFYLKFHLCRSIRGNVNLYKHLSEYTNAEFDWLKKQRSQLIRKVSKWYIQNSHDTRYLEQTAHYDIWRYSQFRIFRFVKKNASLRKRAQSIPNRQNFF